jgi:hypothetical protein
MYPTHSQIFENARLTFAKCNDLDQVCCMTVRCGLRIRGIDSGMLYGCKESKRRLIRSRFIEEGRELVESFPDGLVGNIPGNQEQKSKQNKQGVHDDIVVFAPTHRDHG